MIMLDTHIWHWWINQIPNKISRHLIDLIENSEELAISSISCFEMAWLVKRKRIELPISFDEWLNKVTQNITVLSVTPNIATQAAKLPEYHRDPMDRFIISTALFYQATLISFDSIFPKYCHDGLKLIYQQHNN